MPVFSAQPPAGPAMVAPAFVPKLGPTLDQPMEVWIAIQGIFTNERQVAAHELLFRAPGSHAANLTSRSEHDRATAQVIISTFGEFGVDELSGGHPLFLNVTKTFVTGVLPLPFEATSSVVLEILETIDIDREVERGLHALQYRGFRLALDDFDGEPTRVPLLRFADFVKIDLEASAARLPRLVDLIRAENPDAKIIVERVETADQHAWCAGLGVDLFQGYHFHRPALLKQQALDASLLTCTQLIAALLDPLASTDDIVELIMHDPGLSLRLLRAASSAANAPRIGITSVHQAVVLLGRTRLASWVTIMLCQSATADLNAMSLEWILARAQACRLLVTHAPQKAFTVGLLSSIADILSLSVEVLIRGCSLAADVRAALLYRTGELGDALSRVAHHDQLFFPDAPAPALDPTPSNQSPGHGSIDESQRIGQSLSPFDSSLYIHSRLAARRQVQQILHFGVV